jgi:hypothetical protein
VALISLSQFITNWTGKSADWDGIIGDSGQCVQLVVYYMIQVQGMVSANIPYFNAYQFWADFSQSPLLVANYTQIANTGSNGPETGDIVVYDQSPLIDSEGLGHIDIATANGSSGGYDAFASNWYTLPGGYGSGIPSSTGYPEAGAVTHTAYQLTFAYGWLRLITTGGGGGGGGGGTPPSINPGTGGSGSASVSGTSVSTNEDATLTIGTS